MSRAVHGPKHAITPRAPLAMLSLPSTVTRSAKGDGSKGAGGESGGENAKGGDKNKGKKKGVAEPLDQSDAIYLLKNFQDNILNNIVLRGVNGITNVNPRLLKNVVHKEDSKYVSKDTWILDTTGSNLMDLFALDFIDYTRTYSNDIREVYNCLGIEAARQNILNEFNEVMEASDAYVNYHHLSILCDRMTVKAELVPMFRSGIMNDDIGPISKGTYEMHTEMFLDASRHGDFDQMRGADNRDTMEPIPSVYCWI